MKLLLDTHILLWTLSESNLLPVKARKLIENTENEIFYSVVSLFEIELKRLSHPKSFSFHTKDIVRYCADSGFTELDIKNHHIFALENLEREESAPPHKDPFDRLLICQASTENMLFLTHDRLLPSYIEPCIVFV